MSLVVIYEGQRKVIKIPSPNTLVQALLLEAATQFNVDVAKVAFKHKRTTLDNAQPIRFANLSNNAQIDLIATTGSTSAKNQVCKIALAIEGGENTTETFDASISLYEMLNLLAASSKVPVDVHDRSPEIVYLRAKYCGEDALTATTFTTLGLAGQSARLQLRYSSTASPTPSPRSAAISAINNANAISGDSNSNTAGDSVQDLAMDVVVEPEQTSPTLPTPLLSLPSHTTHTTHTTPLPTTVDSDLLSTTSIHTTNSDSTLLTLSPLPTDTITSTGDTNTTTTTVNTTTNNNNTIITGNTTKSSINTDSITYTSNTTNANTTTTTTLPSPSTTAATLLSDNFDRVSTPAVLTLCKYLLNILLNTTDNKFRRITTDNKVYTTKVAPARGVVEFLQSVGFVYESGVFVLYATGSSTNSSSDNSNGSGNSGSTNNSNVDNNTTLSTTQLNLLRDGYTTLLACLTELDVPQDEQPHNGADIRTILLAAQQQRKEVQQRGVAAQVAFDPYKSHIVRTAPQPVRQKEAVSSGTTGADNSTAPVTPTLTLSSTERQLQELLRKRADLEGRLEDVQRLTEVLLPRADGTIAPLVEPTATSSSADTAMDTTADDRAVPRSVLSKILQKRSPNDDGSDNTPLTTQAVRDLQRIQKERVYNRTLVRVKFPDRACLQGYFHPRHTIHDVYAWVATALVDPLNSVFELYTSPPRTVLVPMESSSGGSSGVGGTSGSSGSSTSGSSGVGGSSGSVDVPTLSSMRLVPAALIYLAWKNKNLKGTTSSTSISSNASSGVSGVKAGSTSSVTSTSSESVGEYFLPELLIIAATDLNSSNSTSAGAGNAVFAYPTGTALAPPSTISDSSSAKLSGVKAGTTSSTTSGGYGGSSEGEVKRSTKPKWFK